MNGYLYHVIGITQIETGEKCSVELLLDERLRDGITDVLLDQHYIQYFRKEDDLKVIAHELNSTQMGFRNIW